MATLNPTHEGVERILRGWNALDTAAHHALGSRKPAESLRTRFARMLEQWRQRVEDEAYEDLMRRDPRVRTDLRAAMDRSEW